MAFNQNLAAKIALLASLAGVGTAGAQTKPTTPSQPLSSQAVAACVEVVGVNDSFIDLTGKPGPNATIVNRAKACEAMPGMMDAIAKAELGQPMNGSTLKGEAAVQENCGKAEVANGALSESNLPIPRKLQRAVKFCADKGYSR